MDDEGGNGRGYELPDDPTVLTRAVGHIEAARRRRRDVAAALVALKTPDDIIEEMKNKWGVSPGSITRDIHEVRKAWREQVEELDIQDRLAMAVQLRMEMYRVCMGLKQVRTAELQLVALEKLWGLYRMTGDGAQVQVNLNWAMLPEADSDHDNVSEEHALEYRKQMALVDAHVIDDEDDDEETGP